MHYRQKKSRHVQDPQHPRRQRPFSLRRPRLNRSKLNPLKPNRYKPKRFKPNRFKPGLCKQRRSRYKQRKQIQRPLRPFRFISFISPQRPFGRPRVCPCPRRPARVRQRAVRSHRACRSGRLERLRQPRSAWPHPSIERHRRQHQRRPRHLASRPAGAIRYRRIRP
jgi:hypothetical protein